MAEKVPLRWLRAKIYFLREHLIAELILRRTIRAWTRNRLRRAGALGALETFLARRPRESFEPDYADLWFLYQTARRRKPEVVLEFGSGCSTVVLAQALEHNGTGYMYSVESDPGWAQSTSAALPDPLKERCEVVHGDALRIDFEGTLAFRHAGVPEVAPNLIYLDGPALDLEEGRLVAVDILDMADRLPADNCIIIDTRPANTEFLWQRLKGYRRSGSRLFRRPVFTKT